MTHKTFTPAASLTAIAAALTLATSPALSQPDALLPEGEAAPGPAAPVPSAPVVSPPPILNSPPLTVDTIPPATAQTAPVTPPLAQTSPTTAPRVVYEQRNPVVQDVPQPEAASPAEAAPAPAPRAAAQPRAEAPARPAETSPATTADTQPARPTPAETAESTPFAAPADTVADTAPATADVAPATPAAQNAEASDAGLSEGAMIGGAALLLLGTGGLAWAALRRRRRPAGKAATPMVAKDRTVTTAAVPVAASEPVRREEVSVAAATATPVEPVLAPVTPAELHARNENVTVLERPAAHSTTTASSDLESMVAAQPDAANPFLTRRNRMRRAKYIMAHGDYAPRSMSASQATPASDTQTATNQTPSRSQPPVYDFGKGAGPQRRPGWKPVTST